jgi:hypothetical protein
MMSDAALRVVLLQTPILNLSNALTHREMCASSSNSLRLLPGNSARRSHRTNRQTAGSDAQHASVDAKSAAASLASLRDRGEGFSLAVSQTGSGSK